MDASNAVKFNHIEINRLIKIVGKIFMRLLKLKVDYYIKLL